MPSAAAKPSNGMATAEVQESLPVQCLSIADKKVRNLEKRRTKLIQLADGAKKGKELNEEQRDAVSRMEQVEQMLEFSKEMQKLYKQLVDQHEKTSRRSTRVEKAARREADVALVSKILRLQSLLDSLDADSRGDFITGKNGACQVSEDELAWLDAFYTATKVSRAGEPEEKFSKALSGVSDHWVLLVERSTKEVAGTTYEKVAQVMERIDSCGYLNAVREEVDVGVDAGVEDELEPAEEVPVSGAEPLDVEQPQAAECVEEGAVAGKPAFDFLHESTVRPRGEGAPASPTPGAEPAGSPMAEPLAADDAANGPAGTEGGAWSTTGDSGRQGQRNRGGRGGGQRGSGRGGRGGRGGGRDFNRGGDNDGSYRRNNDRRGRGGYGGDFNNQRGGGRGGRGGNRDGGPRRGRGGGYGNGNSGGFSGNTGFSTESY